MAAIPIANALPFEGGSVISGIVLTLTSLAMYEYGISFNIFNDKSRQKLVMLISFVGALAGLVFYGSNQTKLSWVVTDISVFILFLCGQYGLVIVNHNSIIRLAVTFDLPVPKVQRLCGVLYLLPWVALVPIYLAFSATISKELALTTSTWNSVVSKLEFLVLIFVTEILATVTDLMLLNKVQKSTSALSQGKNGRNGHGFDLHISYAIIWFFMIADFTVKILITQGYPLLFDAIITISVVVLRARSNLFYGVMLKRVLDGSTHASAHGKSVNQSSQPTDSGSVGL
ncbi:hypothetical protein HDV01_006834 [Terramyces sp. JEL0728]|nr:hypothetical protein HDV01_006834 [Terramyces sp. JEL0728]